MLLQQQRRDEVPRHHEEDLDAEEPAVKRGEPRVIRDDGEHRQTPETIEPRLLTHPGQRTRRCRHRSAPDRGAVTRRLHSPTCLLKFGPDGVRRSEVPSRPRRVEPGR